jgi:hypothetical protein
VEQHDVEITIEKSGEVAVHVKGAKGKGCLKYAEFLANLIGNVKEQTFTSEYYEPESHVEIHLKQELST